MLSMHIYNYVCMQVHKCCWLVIITYVFTYLCNRLCCIISYLYGTGVDTEGAGMGRERSE